MGCRAAFLYHVVPEPTHDHQFPHGHILLRNVKCVPAFSMSFVENKRKMRLKNDGPTIF